MKNIFCSPSRYVQGRDVTLELALELDHLQIKGSVLIVASKSVIKQLSSTWQEAFKGSIHSYFIHQFASECTLEEITSIVNKAQEKKVEVIIGAGGGKVMDAAKAAAHEAGVKLVICPTIAASDAPCSGVSVIYSEKSEVIEIRKYPKNPDLVLVDTKVIASAPKRFLVAGMGDGLSTYFEARTCVLGKKNNVCGGTATLASFAIAKLCYDTLIEDGVMALNALRTKSVNAALERIIEANTLLSGLGFESCGLAAAHAIHNGLTMIEQTHPYLHGEKVAFGTLVQLILEGQKTEEIEEVLNFCFSVGLPITLEQIGIKEINDSILDSIVSRALIESESIHNEPFKVTKPLLKDAILSADEVGRQYLKKRGKGLNNG